MSQPLQASSLYDEALALALRLPPEEREELAIALLKSVSPSPIRQPGREEIGAKKPKNRNFPSSGWVSKRVGKKGDRYSLSWGGHGAARGSMVLRGPLERSLVLKLQEKRTGLTFVKSSLEAYRQSPDRLLAQLYSWGLIEAGDVIELRGGDEGEGE